MTTHPPSVLPHFGAPNTGLTRQRGSGSGLPVCAAPLPLGVQVRSTATWREIRVLCVAAALETAGEAAGEAAGVAAILLAQHSTLNKD